MKDRILGMMLGVAIGDAYGLPVESKTPEEIKTIGLPPFEDAPVSDDTQLTLAVTRGIIEGGLDMDLQKVHHVAAFKESVDGWGRSTRESVRRMANGVSWKKSGNGGAGFGNGVAMKVAPLAAYAAFQNDPLEIDEFIVNLTLMTHQKEVAVLSASVQTWLLSYCLQVDPDEFTLKDFIHEACTASYIPNNAEKTEHSAMFRARLNGLDESKNFSLAQKVDAFDGGSCPCYNSLPFTYSIFLEGPFTSGTIKRIVQSGGDTDSNASMAGALQGALCGPGIFDNLVGGLNKETLNVVEAISDRLYHAVKDK
jgi:ADP-ribosylglycohydrolase